MTHSSILWLVALSGPNSTTSLQILAIKRPSLVPPVVERTVSIWVSALIAWRNASARAPSSVINGLPPKCQSISKSRPAALRIPSRRLRRSSGLLSVEKRKLKSMLSSPGIILFAPVPAWILEIWKLVGWKYWLPLSHSVSTKDWMAGAERWIGFLPRCG